MVGRRCLDDANEGAMNRAPTMPIGPEGARFIAPSRDHDHAALAQIVPPASDEEVAAIVAALAMREEDHPSPEPTTSISRWALAGRRQATRGIHAGPASGWGRQRRGRDG